MSEDFLKKMMGATFTEEDARESAEIFAQARAEREARQNPQDGMVLNGKKFSACKRCSGKGRLPGMEHVRQGICFACEGGKGVWVTA